ncbi:DUF3951 domain-containing protein [Paenibacillus piri]|uniref:DUF3951 domain-containing protein n=1 Tax=Paenibacillus piri TaxID=2547395 RepID=UPI001404A87C|nr:DUF3951 domain-containing protein [Paenibacillus piri]
MDITSIILLALIGPVFILIIYIMTKAVIKKNIPDSRYQPFDYIMGQTSVQVQEQKEEKEDEDEHGDDKDKNLKKQ